MKAAPARHAARAASHAASTLSRSVASAPQALRAIDYYSRLAVEGLVPSNALDAPLDDVGL